MIRTLTAAVCLLATAQGEAKDFYVSLQGSDRNPGTSAKPFASLERARDAVRASKGQGAACQPVNIYLRSGVYTLHQTFVLRPEDSGTAACPITWQAMPGEIVLISGGTEIKSDWKSSDGKVWHTDIAEIRDSKVKWPDYRLAERERRVLNGRWHFRQLFVDGKRATRARYPNASAAEPYLYTVAETNDPYVPAPKGSVKPVWGSAPDAHVWINANWNGYNFLSEITRVDPSVDRIHVFDSTRRWRITGTPEHSYDKPDWFFVEGVREELDEPGEWYLDPVAGRLYYMPPDGTMKGKTVIAPRLDTLVLLDGDPKTRTHVEHVNFKNLRFAYSQSTLGQIEPRVSIDAALILRNARNCRIEACEIYSVGGNAIWLQYDSQVNTITKNHIHDAGAAGVLTSGGRFGWMQEESALSVDRDLWRYSPLGTTITHNRIEHINRIYLYGPGIHIDSAPARLRYQNHAYIAHNQFVDLAKKAVFLFLNVGNAVVEFNEARQTCWGTNDTAVYYGGSGNRESGDQLYFLNNRAADIPGRTDGYPRTGVFGILYVDHGSGTVHFENNIADGNLRVRPTNLMIFQNTIGAVSKNPTYGGNIWKAEAHAGMDLKNIEVESTARNEIAVEEGLGAAAEWWETDVVKKTGIWNEYVEVKAGSNAPGIGVVATTSRLLKHTGGAATRDWIEFSIPAPRDGVYEAFLYFKHNDDAASTNTPVTIFHSGGESVVRLDQRAQRKSLWARYHGYPLGAYTLRAGQGRIRIGTEGTDGAVYVSCAAFVRKNIYFADNDFAGVALSGSWNRSGVKPVDLKHGIGAHYGDDYLRADPGAGASATYPLKGIIEANLYDVYLWHIDGGPKASSKTTVDIRHGETTESVRVDMRTGGGRWKKLGRYPFDASDRQFVRIRTDGADGVVFADAVKLVKVRDDRRSEEKP